MASGFCFTPIMSSPHSNWSLPVPSLNQAYIKVSALEAGFIALPDAMFITPTSPIRGPDHITNAPSLSFLLTHEKNGQRMLFDLGLRKNHSEAPENGGYPPIVKSWIEKVYNLSVPRDVRDSIRKGMHNDYFTDSNLTTRSKIFTIILTFLCQATMERTS